MAANSKIEWTDHTFNPWIGCTKVSPGCDHCYAERREDQRLHRVQWGAGKPRQRTKTWGDPVRWNKLPFYACAECSSSCTWRGNGDGESCPACGGHVVPARPRVFCASLADVFDNEVDPAWRDELLGLIVTTPNLDWLLLTKRIGNVSKMLKAEAWAQLPQVWLGATVVNQEEADRDIPKLLAIPARVRFLSIEPMLGPIDLERPMPGPDLDQGGGQMICQPWLIQSGIDWVIVGGESGHGARPMHPAWVRGLRDQCAHAGVPFLFKQWGEWLPGLQDGNPARRVREINASNCLLRVGKSAAGRVLDSMTHDAFPEPRGPVGDHKPCAH